MDIRDAGVPFDKRHIRRYFGRAASIYDAAAVLQRRVGDRLIDRLGLVRLQPERVLDAGCGTGYATRALERRYRRAEIVGVDIARPMLLGARGQAAWFTHSRFVQADAEHLPFAAGCFDMIVSNLLLPWCELAAVFGEFLRVMRTDGLFAFTTLGPDTLQELRAAWRQADMGGHVHEFLDMHDVGDALVHAGFADPVMDVERYTLTYPDLDRLLRDLQALGAQNALPNRARGLTGRVRFGRFRAAYEALRKDGCLAATVEVVYGHAWAPATRRARDGAARIPIASIGRRR